MDIVRKRCRRARPSFPPATVLLQPKRSFWLSMERKSMNKQRWENFR